MQRYILKSKQFRLPIEEEALNRIYNLAGAVIIEKKIFQDRAGDIVVYLEWQQISDEE